jgi:hypothetical protein
MDKDLKDFDNFLKKEENRIIMEDINKRMAKAKEEILEYDDIDGEDNNHELVDVADLIVENKLYIDKIDNLIGK